MQKFRCKSCGECCKDFGLIKTLPIFWFEKERYEKLARERGIELEFLPENILKDKISGKTFCLNYGMKGNPCLLLKNNNCSIYKQRALICKAFPLDKIAKNPFDFHLGYFMKCKTFEPEVFVKQVFGQPNYLENYKQVFGQEILNSKLNIDRIKSEICKVLRKLEREGKIKLEESEEKNNVLPLNIFLERFNIHLDNLNEQK